MNGKINAKVPKVIENKGTLKIQGGEIIASSIPMGIDSSNYKNIYGIYNTDAGNVEITEGTITASTSYIYSSAYGIYNASAGNVKVTGGTITASANLCTKYGIYNAGAGNIEITGGTITASSNSYSSYGIYNEGAGNVEITGGMITASSNSATSYGIYNNGAGNVEISGGEVIGNASYRGDLYVGGYGIYNNSTGTIKVTEGKITGIAKGSSYYDTCGYGIYNSSTGTVEIEGGEIIANSSNSYRGSYAKSYGIYNNSTGTIKLTGGTITSTGYSDDGIYNNGAGNIEITSGTITSTSYYGRGIYNNSGTITLGEKDGEISLDNISIYGGEYGLYNVRGIINFYDGIIEGKASNSIYGTVTDMETDYDVVRYKNGESEKHEVASGREIAILEKQYIVKVESSQETYTSIKDALENVNDEDTITMIKNTTIIQSADSAIVDEGKSVTLDLAGHTVTSSNENTIINKGTLEIVNSVSSTGQISATNTIINNKEGGKLIMTSGTLTSTISGTSDERKGTIKNEAEMIVQGGSITASGIYGAGIYSTGTVEVTGGTITGSGNYGAGIYSTGTVEVTGGTITGNYSNSGAGIYSIGIVKLIDGKLSGYYGIYNNGTEMVEITGGTITGNCYGIYNASTGTVKITGGTISGNSSSGIYNASTGTVKLIDGKVSSGGNGIYNNSTGNVEITGGTITASSSSYDAKGIYNNAGTVEVTGATITGTTSDYNDTGCGIWNNTGTIKIIDGEVAGHSTYPYTSNNSKRGYGIYNQGTGTVEVLGGNITGSSQSPDGYAYASGIFNNSTGTIKIQGGSVTATSISSNCYGISNASGTITLGEKDGEISLDNPSIQGTNYGLCNTNGIFNFYDGTIEGTNGKSIWGAVTTIEDDTNLNLTTVEEREKAILQKNGSVVQVGENTYTNLKDAIEACTEDENTITILDNFAIVGSEKVTIAENQNIVLDLNGKTITTFAPSTIVNNGTLEIADNSESKNGKIVSRGIAIILTNNKTLKVTGGTITGGTYGIYNNSTETLKIEGGTITGSSYGIYNYSTGLIEVAEGAITATSGSGIYNNSSGSITVTNGTVTGSGYGINNGSGGAVTVAGGTVRATSGDGIWNESSGSITVTNGTVTASSYGIDNRSNGAIEVTGGTITGSNVGIYKHSSGSITVAGGTVTGTDKGIYNNSNLGTVTVTGGTITGNYGIYNSSSGTITLGENEGGVPDQTTPEIIGTTYGVYNNSSSGKFNFYDGKVTGGTSAIYGKVTDYPKDYDVMYLDDSKTIAVIGIVEDFESTVKVGDVYYDSIKTAIAIIASSSSKTDTIHVCGNMELKQGITIPEGTNITIALEEHTLSYTGEAPAITNNGTLTIIDYEDVSEADASTLSILQNSQGPAIQNNGTLIIGQANSPNTASPKIIGNPAIKGNLYTKNSGTIEDSGSTTYGFMRAQLRNLASKDIYTLENATQTFALSTKPEMKLSQTEWSKEDVQVDITADVIPTLNLYVSNGYDYTVEYYYDGELDTDKTETLAEIYGTQIEDYEDKVIAGYKLEKTENFPLTVSKNAEENVIKVYYVKDEFDYTVEYYYDGELDEDKTATLSATYGDVIDTYEDKIITGYKVDREENLPLNITEIPENNVIKVYYAKDKFTYTVEYYYDGELNNDETETLVATYGDIIDTYEDKNITGYKLQKTENFSLTISEKADENVIKVYYIIDEENKKTLTYTVEYYKDNVKVEEDTQTETLDVQILQPDTLIVDKTKINTTDKYEGYRFQKTTSEEIPTEITTGEVIKVYYQKELKVNAQHIDKNTGTILGEETKIGVINETYETASKSFENYVLVEEPENKTGTFNEDEITITYYYVHVSNGVIEKHVDLNTGDILYSKLHEGNEGDLYSTVVKEFEGYDADEERLPLNAQGTLPLDTIEVIYYYKYKVQVTVQYVNKMTEEEIITAEIMDLHETEEYETEAKEFDGYVLVEEPENKAGTISRDNITVTYYYKKISGGVIEKHIDLNTEEVLYTETHEGNEGAPYSTNVKEFEGYDVIEEKLPENANGTMTIEPIEVIYYYNYKTKVTVKYVDQNTNEEIIDAEVISLHAGEEYQTELRQIEGYKVVEEPENKSGTIDKEEIVVTYYYKRISGGVIEKHIDLTTGEVLYTETHEGNEGDPYSISARKIEGYHVVEEKLPQKAEGIMTIDPIEVIYVYEKTSAKVVVKYVDENGNTLSETTIDGHVGDQYSIKIKEIEGYTITNVPENAEGTMTEDTITVTYTYQKNKVEEPKIPEKTEDKKEPEKKIETEEKKEPEKTEGKTQEPEKTQKTEVTQKIEIAPKAEDKEVVYTGDDDHIGKYIAMIVISGTYLISMAIVFVKKQKKK